MTAELAGTAARPSTSVEFAALYAQAQRFYAHQMRILDAHDTELWARTFTEDAVLELPSLPEPVRARAGLAHYVRAGAARQRRAGHRLDHWVGMLDVRPQVDGSLRTRCSALVYATPGDGGPRVLYVCVMEDVLVRAHGTWRAAHRRVTRDDLA
ncbi:nuclear transport factor 2 family protein [Streptomyces sp. NPDC033538]|uniref:nuclear transport factor 2 family protein n=1 Tax=Streptomyces sp. NPDC033538 TaxID=3155367 RepID=UPI0033D58E45